MAPGGNDFRRLGCPLEGLNLENEFADREGVAGTDGQRLANLGERIGAEQKLARTFGALRFDSSNQEHKAGAAYVRHKCDPRIIRAGRVPLKNQRLSGSGMEVPNANGIVFELEVQRGIEQRGPRVAARASGNDEIAGLLISGVHQAGIADFHASRRRGAFTLKPGENRDIGK